MKLSIFLLIGTFFTHLVAGASFSAVDQEIFKINHELKEDLGEHMDFYKWLKLEKGAKSSFEEIARAYKKLSIKLHPDKFMQKNRNKYPAKQLKKLQKLNNQRYERLSVIGEILRSESKLRYDFYLSNGFPKWNGQGFFYSKFKPGVLAALLIVFVIVNILHYILLSLQRKSEKKRIDTLKEQIKSLAWPNGYPPADFGDRKISSPQLDKNFLVKGDGSVYLIEQDDKGNDTGLHFVSSDDVKPVTYRDSLIYRLVVFLWNSSLGKVAPSLRIVHKEVEKDTASDAASAKPETQKKKKSAGQKKELANGKVAYGATKTGGRRRK